MARTQRRWSWAGAGILSLLVSLSVLAQGTPAGQGTTQAPASASTGAPQAPAPDLALTAPLPRDPAVRMGRLDNGLTYYIRQNGRPAQRVSLRLAVNAGSLQEADDQRGLAHFLEHMAFNGTDNFKPGELVAFLESIGARFGPHVNASTSFDETIYMLDVPTDRPGYVDRGLLALRDFAAGIQLLPAEVDRERGVVLEEWRGRLGASSRITDQQIPIIFRGSRYADRLPIGTPEIIQKAPRERIAEFYRQHYRPDQMAVVVVGDLAPDAAETMVRARFAGIPARTAPVAALNRAVPGHAEPLVSVVTDPEAQSWTVTLGIKGTPAEQRTVADYRASLVRQMLEGMINPRLRELSQRPNAPFLGAQAGIDTIGRSLQLFDLSAAVPEQGQVAGLEALVTEARRVQRHGFSEAELDRARRELLAGYERAYNERGTSENPSFAREYVSNFLEGEPMPGIEFEYRLARAYLPTITAAEVTAAATALLSAENRIILAVAPQKADQPPATREALLAAVAKAEAADVAPWRDETAGRTLVSTPPTPGRVTAQRTLPAIGVTVLTLSNGAEVWLKPTDYKADQVLFGAQALGGTSLADEADYFSADLAPALVSLGGMGGFTPVDLDKVLAGRIASATPQLGTYTHEVGGAATPRDLEVALQLNYLAFTAPNLTSEAFDLLKRRLGAVLQNQAQNPRAVFGERVSLINQSQHYSARMLSMADLPRLKLETMQAYYRARYGNAADFTFFFVGAFDTAAITPLIERWIGGLPSTGTRTAQFRDMGVRFPANAVREQVRKGREPASQTVISLFADPGNDEFELHRLRAATSVLSLRLRELLREQLGGTYGVSVSFESAAPLRGYGSVVVQFGSAPDRVETLTRAVFDEVARLAKEGPSADDVAKVKEMEKRDLETNARQNAYWMGSLQTVLLYGWDPEGIARRPQRTEQLTPAAVHEMFRKYFTTDRVTVVSLMPEA